MKEDEVAGDWGKSKKKAWVKIQAYLIWGEMIAGGVHKVLDDHNNVCYI